jgi:hypothetical protein
VFTIAAALFFILFALSTFDQLAILSIVSIVAAVVDVGACVPVALFALFPSSRKQTLRIAGIVPCLLAAVVSACVLGWMGLRQQDLPQLILGKNSTHVLLGAFAVLVLTIALQSVFWTILFISSPAPLNNDQESNPPATTAPCRCAHRRSTDVAFSAPALATCKSPLGSTIPDSKHRSFITQVYHSAASPKAKGRGGGGGSLYTIEDKEDAQSMATVATSHRSEVNHFDDWETSDVSATERVAATLAVIQQEEEAEEGPQPPTRPSSSVYSSDHSVPERRCSPPLPETDVVSSPRTPRRDAFQFPVNAALASPMSTRFPFRGGGAAAGGASDLGGTGKWLARSPTTEYR